MVDAYVVKKKLESIIKEYGYDKKYIIFPYGEYGKMVKAVLNTDFGIQEILIIDNGLSAKRSDIAKNIDELRDIDKSDEYILLVSSCRHDLHQEILNQIAFLSERISIVDVFEKEYIAELHGGESYEIYEFKRSVDVNQIKVYEKLHSEGRFNDFIYAPSKTKSKFFLPFLFIDCIQQEIFLKDDYKDADTLRWIFCEFNGGVVGKYTADKIAIDAGANIGNHSLFFINETELRNVYSFEPVPNTYRILENNVEINNLKDCITLYNCGLGDSLCKMSVGKYIYENIGGTALRNNGTDIDVITVDSLNLNENIKFFKIDVEGMELKVLQGAIETIKSCRPVIMIESFDKYQKICDLLDQIQYDNTPLGPNDYLFYPHELMSM